MPLWLIVVLIVLGGAVLVVAALMTVSFLAVRRADRNPSLIGASLSTVANCVAVTGADRSVTGTGTLALFDDEVCFVGTSSRRELRIPRRRLTVTLEARSGANRKRVSTDDSALVLTWKDDGRKCSAEFLVPDPAAWRSVLLR